MGYVRQGSSARVGCVTNDELLGVIHPLSSLKAELSSDEVRGRRAGQGALLDEVLDLREQSVSRRRAKDVRAVREAVTGLPLGGDDARWRALILKGRTDDLDPATQAWLKDALASLPAALRKYYGHKGRLISGLLRDAPDLWISRLTAGYGPVLAEYSASVRVVMNGEVTSNLTNVAFHYFAGEQVVRLDTPGPYSPKSRDVRVRRGAVSPVVAKFQ